LPAEGVAGFRPDAEVVLVDSSLDHEGRPGGTGIDDLLGVVGGADRHTTGPAPRPGLDRSVRRPLGPDGAGRRDEAERSRRRRSRRRRRWVERIARQRRPDRQRERGAERQHQHDNQGARAPRGRWPRPYVARRPAGTHLTASEEPHREDRPAVRNLPGGRHPHPMFRCTEPKLESELLAAGQPSDRQCEAQRDRDAGGNPASTSVNACTISTSRAAPTTSTYPPPTSATARRVREVTGTTRRTTAAATAAAVATAGWPEGKISAASPCHRRCTSCFSSISAASAAGTTVTASRTASRRPARQLRRAQASIAKATTCASVPEMTAAARPACWWAISCQRYAQAST